MRALAPKGSTVDMDNHAVVVITGASTGFGRLMAETLARNGHRVYATMRAIGARNADAAREIHELAARERLSLQALELDVTDEASIARAIETVESACGGIDVLINNAGYGILGLAESITPEQGLRQFETNFFGVQRMNRAVLPRMRERRSGLLVHISSGAGRLALPGLSMYCASKFALEALAEVYRYELASLGIDSVIIEPGAYPTPIMAKFEPGEDADRGAAYGAAARIPEVMGAGLRSAQGNPQEIADCVLKVIATPAGQRRLRYRVGPGGNGADRINALTDEVQAETLVARGLAPFTKFLGS
jgi:NAD(P)-dependent dehydrogenase (short-subunit alcohol dehydrogenase family)